jgi:hypothetical protein
MDLQMTVSEWVRMVMASACGLALLSLVFWWEEYEILLNRLT